MINLVKWALWVGLLLLWLLYGWALLQKVLDPTTKNLRGEEFYLVGLVLALLTVFIWLGFRRTAGRN